MVTVNPTPTYFLENLNNNKIYIKRDDLFPFSFGGNKARKGLYFFHAIDNGSYTAVVTYGSGSSNHCRVIANLAAARHLPCHIVSTDKTSPSLNRTMVEMFGAIIHYCTVDQVESTIQNLIMDLQADGFNPFFIPGGGHGNIGTMAYDFAYDEICAYENSHNLHFNYIFLASGTGTTHAGLICGKHRKANKHHTIVGISIARTNPHGQQVVSNSVLEYLGYTAEDALLFEDHYICGGYGLYDKHISHTISRVLTQYGIPLDPTYTGKAYAGMELYLKEHSIQNKNILFLHTGGTPIFYDWIKSNEYFDIKLWNPQ